MAVELVEQRWCDVHLQRDERVAGSTLVLAVDGMREQQVELCGECLTTYWEPMGALLRAEGHAGVATTPTKPARRAKGSGVRFPCPLGCGYTSGRSSMRRHLEITHETVLAKEEAKMGQTLDGQPLPFTCKRKGCGVAFTRPQGLALHVKRAHS